MKKLRVPSVTAGIIASWLGLLVGCSTSEHGKAAGAQSLALDSLVGRWQYDSAGACIYNAQGQLLNCFMDALPPGAVLTVGAERWTYSGSVREEHSYSRAGRTLQIRRLVDSAVVRMQYASQQDLGHVFGRPQTTVIAQLTPQRLVMVDSTTDADGSITAWRYYHSR